MTIGRERSYLITGAGGMLGTALQQLLAEEGARFTALGHADLDITDAEAVEEALQAFAEGCEREGIPGSVVNAAAYTDVEGAEDDPEGAFGVNDTGTGNVATAATAAELGLVHVSTDFVFDGFKGEPYTEEDEPRPLSIYGASKLEGERTVAAVHPEALIVRTAWVYGQPSGGFPAKVLARARSGEPLWVVDTEKGSPTYAPDLARGIVGLVDAGARGLYHLAGTGSCSRYEMALKVVEFAGLTSIEVEPVDGSKYPSKATRPADGTLDCSRARELGVALPAWEVSLEDYVSGVPQEQ